MANRFFILPFFGVVLLFLFAQDNQRPPGEYQSQINWHEIAVQLDSLKAKMYRLEEEKKIDSLKLLKSKFDLPFTGAPDSIRIRFRACYMYYGYLQSQELSDNWSALQYYLLAHQFVKNPKIPDSLSWFVENRIANLYTRLNDYDKSEYFAQLTETSLKHYQKYTLLSRLYSNKGINQLSLGNNAGAIQYFNKGLSIADSLKYSTGIFSNNLGLAEIYLDLSQDSLAGKYLLEAEKYLPELIDDEQYLLKKSAFEAALGKHYSHVPDPQNSFTHYRAAVRSLQQYYQSTNLREFAKLYIDIAKANLAFHHFDSAQHCIHLGLKALLPDYTGRFENLDTSQFYKENSFVELAEVQHNLLVQQYLITRDTSLLRKAYTCVVKGLFVNDRLRSYLILDPSKLSAIRYNKRLTNYGIEDLYALYQLHPNPLYLKQTRDLFTRSKSILYNEKIKTQNIISLLTLQEKMTRDSIEYAMLVLLDKKYEEHAPFYMINNELLELQEKLNEIASRHTENKRKIIHLDQYIEYVQTDSVLFAYSEFDRHAQITRLGTVKQLNVLVARLIQHIALKEMSNDTQVSRDLYDFLISPLKIEPANKLVIIPDGQVSLIPFELLQDKEGKYLLEKSTISYEYQYDPYVLQDAKIKKPNFIYCLAPQYHLPPPAQASRGGLFELPYAKYEVEQVGKIIGNQALISDDSDKRKCITEIKNSRIFHYSGHAIIKPEAAYLALSDQHDLAEQLTDQEITLMSNPMDMVVLSACETGLGKWEYGEGIRSLGRSFMEAGAGAAIYSLWRVNDQSTARIMGSFYRYLKKGYPKDMALTKAKREFLHESKEPYLHPFHWAPFIATGDMTPIAKKFPFLMLISVFLVALSIVLWNTKRKQKRSPYLTH